MNLRNLRPVINNKNARGLKTLALLGRENSWRITMTDKERDELHDAIEYVEALSEWQGRG